MPRTRRHVTTVLATVLATTLAALAATLATGAPASADAATTVHITGPASVVVGTTVSKAYDVTGTLHTPAPADTDISWNLEGSSKKCLLFEYGDATGTPVGAFSDRKSVV